MKPKNMYLKLAGNIYGPVMHYLTNLTIQKFKKYIFRVREFKWHMLTKSRPLVYLTHF